MSQNYDAQDSNKEERKPENLIRSRSDPPAEYTNPSYYPDRPAASSAFAKWLLLLTHPNVKTYAEEGSDANLITAIMNALLFAAFIVIYAIIAAIVQSISAGVSPATLIFYIIIFLTLLAILASVLGLFTGSGIIYLLAKTLGGGHGDFTTQTYLFSIYNVPIAIISTILGSFGQVGTIAGYILGIYELFLTYIMIRTAHQISPLRAALVAVAYAVVAILLILFMMPPLFKAVLRL